MKNKCALLIALLSMLVFGTSLVNLTYAEEEKSGNTEEEQSEESFGTSISISPVSDVIQLSSSSVYENSFEVKNDGKKEIDIEVYAAPYSYVFSEDTNAYQLGFSHENNFTQITRWISFKDASGKWVEKPVFKVKANGKVEVHYRVSTPKSIPAGGQYAVLFAHALTPTTDANGIKTEASPGLIVFGRSTEGEVNISVEVSDLKIEQNVLDGEARRDNIFASAKVKNDGNVDFSAIGVLKVDPIIGGGSYETENGGVHISVIPETELVLSDEWEETPSFGIYRATWTVKAGGEDPQIVEKLIFINPLPLILITIILLTIIITWVIITVRKRKERRSRLSA
ncbi:hypothetical protein IKE97_00370 [Candidatus Saccharibacteria bacterium]|nr:hypothetical protein [Candidatus Saccharibacteria bacterium]